jgi:hypothetical protein
VDKNPLEDVANLSKWVGIMLRGTRLPEAQLREMLDGLVGSYTPNFFERVWPMSLIALGVFSGSPAFILNQGECQPMTEKDKPEDATDSPCVRWSSSIRG